MILVFGKNGQVGNELSKYPENICLSSSDFNFENPSSFIEILLFVLIDGSSVHGTTLLESETDFSGACLHGGIKVHILHRPSCLASYLTI